MILLVVLGSCLVAAASGRNPTAKNVVVSLDSRWSQTSVLQEASEFMAAESNHVFWRYLNAVTKTSGESITAYTNKELYDFSLKTAEKLLSPARLDLLKFSLSMRTFSPAVVFHRQVSAMELEGLDCSAAVDLNGYKMCISVNDLAKIDELLASKLGEKSAQTYKVDHHFPGTAPHPKRVIFYAILGSIEMEKVHPVLKKKAVELKYDYIFRHSFKTVDPRPVRLSGYGVELAIKSTEYKAQDDSKIKANISGGAIVEEEEETDLNGFDFKTLKELHPDLKDKLDEFKIHLLEADELTPLKVWQLQDLSFQAGQRVVQAGAAEAVKLLQDISQNFPLMARAMTRTVVKEEFRKEVEKNQRESFEDLGIAAGDSALFINGLLVDTDPFDAFGLLDLLKKEEKLSAGFFRMGYRREYLSILTNLDLTKDKETYAIDFRTGFPDYINNLDTDKQYRQWGNSVKIMLQPYFPGMIRPIARNFFTLVFVVDPSVKEARSLLKIAHSFFAHEIPIRIGLIFVVNSDKQITGKDNAGVALLNIYNFVKIDKNPSAALSFLTDIYDQFDEEILPEHIIRHFKKKFPGEDPDMVFGADSDYDTGRQAGAQFLESSGLGKVPKVLLNGVPLDDGGLTADRFEETVINEIMRITPKLQREIMDGKLSDSDNVMDFIMSRPEVMPRLNARILSPQNSHYIDMTDTMEYHQKIKRFYDFSRLDERQMAAYMVKTIKYLKKNDDLACRPVTVWIVADLESPAGRQLCYNAIKHLKHSAKMRIGVIHNSNTTLTTADVSIAKIYDVAMRTLPLTLSKSFVTKLVKEEFAVPLLKGKLKLEDLAVHGMSVESFKKELSLFNFDHFKYQALFTQNILGILPGQSAIVVNGQVIGPLHEVILTEDFALLEKHVMSSHAQVIADQIELWQIEHEDEKSSDVVMRTSSLVMDDPIRKKRNWVVLQGDKDSVVSIPASDETTAAFDVVAIVDPLSKDAQRIAPLLGVLMNVINADFKVVMNCKPKLSEMPLKTFYRVVLEPQLQFNPDGQLRHGPLARFSSLPLKTILTMNVEPPDSWLIEAVRAAYDLDNIKLEEADHDIIAEYELTNLLLEGHCYDEVTGNPPRGLQFTLGPDPETPVYDTIVMANLGYFQLKASPGAWILKLREGKSQEIYDITSFDNAGDTSVEPSHDQVPVLLNSFSGKTVRIRVAKKPDKINEHLLVETADTEEKSIWKSLSSKFSGGSKDVDKDEDPTINIFSLASGHLYERLLRIMMLSVLKTTKHPVKFWFLQNYLSPYFKKFLPYLAKHYGFQYELVQYKWPKWLHKQTEKQRLIWAYKILFLDVLFPLDVKKFIFVDADQVVRTDLKELVDFDLEGAPYGYTPFCDSRKEMDGFRFWKSGYWANHLAGRKYHISALYVVDLKKFRQIAAGDRLRGQYQGLSADPNSLSNLDQDLPNNMIHQVKIKSLPQEWLWCETWCDDASKGKAKTIDLCNNPLTKESKLTAAMRIIAEWKDYDDELRALKDQFDAEGGATVFEGGTAVPPTAGETGMPSIEPVSLDDGDQHQEL